MSYGGSASSVISKKNDINNVVTSVNNLDFDSVWKSQASQKLLSSLDNLMNKINTEMSNLQAYADALRKIDECIEIDGRIADLSARLSAIDTDTVEGADDAASIRAEISRLKSKKEQIKNQIKGIISGFGSVGAEFAMSFTGISAASWNELVVMAEEFKKLDTGNLFKALTLYDDNGNVIRDGEEYVNDRINAIKARYTGVERNFYVSKAIIELSLEAGVRVPYAHNGTTSTGKGIDTRIAVPTSTLGKGIDCNAFASYVIFDENSTEKWLEVGKYDDAGVAVNSYEEMQAGDIFANGGHVGLIVANNPETGEALVLHATSKNDVMEFEKVNYSYFDAKGHSIRRVDSNYVSPELAKILNIDTSNYTPSSSGVNISNANYVPSNSDVNVGTSVYNNTVSLSTDSYDYMPDVSIGSLNRNGDVYNGQALTAPQGINRNGPLASETWYDLPMSGVVKNMEKLYGYTDLEASIRDDGVKVLSGVTPDGERFEDLVMVAADVEHMSNPDGTFERGEIVATSLGTGIVVDACGRSISERKSTGNVHFDIATAWGTGEYKEAAYADYNKS